VGGGDAKGVKVEETDGRINKEQSSKKRSLALFEQMLMNGQRKVTKKEKAEDVIKEQQKKNKAEFLSLIKHSRLTKRGWVNEAMEGGGG
jgi:hypothetical protein